MLRFGKTKLLKEEIYSAKKSNENFGINVTNIVILKLVKTKNKSKYLIGFLDEVIKPLVFILPKTIGYIKTFKLTVEMFMGMRIIN